MMRWLFLLLVIATSAHAASTEDLRMLYSNDFTFTKKPPTHRGSVAVHSSFQIRGRSREDREDLIYAVVRDRLVRNNIRVSAGSNDYLRKFKSQVDASNPGSRTVTRMSARQLLQPRLFANFAAVEQGNPKLFRLEGYIALIGYTFDQKNSLEATPAIAWHQSVNIRDLSEGEVHEKMVVVLRRVMDDFVVSYKSWRDEEKGLSSGSGGVITATYQKRSLPNLHEEIEDLPEAPRPVVQNVSAAATTTASTPRRRYLQLGASLGTPATGNLHAGIWGYDSVPILIHGSGMYYTPETRGTQIDLGYIFDREGSYQQAISSNFLLFNETRTDNSTVAPSRVEGRTQTVHIRELKPSVGLSYIAQWGPVRLQAGGAIRLGPGDKNNLHLLFQAGFVPLLPF